MPALNQEVYYKILLNLINTLSIFTTKTNHNQAATQTLNIFKMLIHADDEQNRKYLLKTGDYLSQNTVMLI